jgi:hypothetical protein
MVEETQMNVHESPVDKKTLAVVKVGDGRGFVVGGSSNRHVITAAHCLPQERYPVPHLANSVSELTIPNIIGALGEEKRTIWAQLSVLNLIDDLAVLSAPDDQALWEPNEEYEEFLTHALTIGKPPAVVPPRKRQDTPGEPAFVLSLDRAWQSCTVHNQGRFLTLGGAKIDGGMSGSPILNAKGQAIGLISTGSDNNGEAMMFNVHTSLMDCLAPWLVRQIKG